jgi:hypothetical protein
VLPLIVARRFSQGARMAEVEAGRNQFSGRHSVFGRQEPVFADH